MTDLEPITPLPDALRNEGKRKVAEMIAAGDVAGALSFLAERSDDTLVLIANFNDRQHEVNQRMLEVNQRMLGILGRIAKLSEAAP